jgi:hypothetical protein
MTKTLVLAAIVAVTGAGCVRVDATEVHVRDPRGVGVVADKNNQWLLPPHSPPETVEVHRSFAVTATLTRSASGAINYTSEHWALGKRVDTTPLTDGQGRDAWTETPAASERLKDAIEHGGEVRLHGIEYVRETGPFGLCNGTLFDECITNPAVGMSLATDSRNVAEVRVVRTPVRSLGIWEVIFGAAAVGVGAVDGAVLLPSQPGEGRTIALGVGAGLVILGGLAIANGIWRLLAPDQEFVYRPPTDP